jgi:hypothetical protein
MSLEFGVFYSRLRTNYSELSPVARTLFTEMIFEGPTTFSYPVVATVSAKK